MNYTVDQMRVAYKNAKAAGDEQAANMLFQAIIGQRMKEEAQTLDPTEGMSGLQKFVVGIGQGLSNVGRHAGNMVGMVSDEDLAESKRLDTHILNTGAGKAGSFLGEMAATAPIGMGVAGLAGRTALGAKTVASPIGRGVVEGATQGAVMADPGERGAGAVLGGALGSVLPGVAAGARKMATGVSRTPEAQMLLDRGVDLTPGQMNPGGVLNHMEEAWQSVPLVGSAISAARQKGQQGFQRVLAEEAAAPGTKIAQGGMDEMLDAAYKSFQPLYDQAKGFPVSPKIMTSTGTDVPLSSAFQQAARSGSVRATDETRKSVSRWLANQLTQIKGNAQSDDLLALRSNIRGEMRKAKLSQDTAAHDLLQKAEKSVTEALDSQLPPAAMQAVKTADAQYGKYKILEDAVRRGGDQPGGATPAQVSQAVRSATEAGQYARGGGRMRDLASAGREVFTPTQAPTGQRLAAIGLPLAAGAMEPVSAATVGSALAGLIGTQTGRKLAAGSTKGQKLAQALMEKGKKALPDPYRDILAGYLRAGSVGAMLPNER